VITDGGDDWEDTSKKAIEKLKATLNKEKINILMIGYTYNEEKISFLQQIASATLESEYIYLEHADNLEPFFKSLREGPTGN